MVESPFLEASERIAGETWVEKLLNSSALTLVMFSVRSVKNKTCFICDLLLKEHVDIPVLS